MSIINPYDNYNIICDANNLIDAFNLANIQSKWKESNRKFKIDLLPNIYDLLDELSSFSYVPNKPYEFIINERGKTRYIRANSIRVFEIELLVMFYVIKFLFLY